MTPAIQDCPTPQTFRDRNKLRFCGVRRVHLQRPGTTVEWVTFHSHRTRDCFPRITFRHPNGSSRVAEQ
jgi:hypothetical protein